MPGKRDGFRFIAEAVRSAFHQPQHPALLQLVRYIGIEIILVIQVQHQPGHLQVILRLIFKHGFRAEINISLADCQDMMPEQALHRFPCRDTEITRPLLQRAPAVVRENPQCIPLLLQLRTVKAVFKQHAADGTTCCYSVRCRKLQLWLITASAEAQPALFVPEHLLQRSLTPQNRIFSIHRTGAEMSHVPLPARRLHQTAVPGTLQRQFRIIPRGKHRIKRINFIRAGKLRGTGHSYRMA
ncbi:hypothetical protein D3C75_668210 [compost metagenome]